MTIKIKEVEEIITSRKLKEQELTRLQTRLEIEQDNYRDSLDEVIQELKKANIPMVNKKNAMEKMNEHIAKLELEIEEEMAK
jgi:predicted  nucleic acid-binding Zn-ribbon protein